MELNHRLPDEDRVRDLFELVLEIRQVMGVSETGKLMNRIDLG